MLSSVTRIKCDCGLGKEAYGFNKNTKLQLAPSALVVKRNLAKTFAFPV